MTGITSKRIGDLINDVEEGRLVLRPFFQRRLVWTNVVKDKFLETVRLGLPFPEIFVATGEIDTKTTHRKNWLVDGQQRISTLREYILGSEDLRLKLVKPYSDLSEKEKTDFLNYQVAVRDLGTVNKQQIKEIFSRINSTDYALRSMEKLNAMYNGAYIKFCEHLAHKPFFEDHSVFSTVDWRRMRDLDFCVILITTILSTYYHRDELNREYLERYNDDFPEEDQIEKKLTSVFDFIERCEFEKKSRVWKKTDLFTLLVEIYSALHVQGMQLDSDKVGNVLKSFYSKVDELYSTTRDADDKEPANFDTQVFKYLKAATKATNDKYARVARAEVVSDLLKSTLSRRKSPKQRNMK